MKAKISLLDINKKKLFQFSKELKKMDAEIITYKVDVSKKKDLKKSLKFTLKNFGDVEGLIKNYNQIS